MSLSRGGQFRRFVLIAVVALLGSASIALGADVSWQPMGAGGGGAFKDSIVIQPNDANFAMVGTDTAGPVVTTNGGATWTMPMEGLLGLHPGQVHYTLDLAIDPVASQNVYFATMGLFKTANFGGLWSQRAEAGTVYKSVAVDPQDPNFVFAGQADYGPGTPTTIARSPDKWLNPNPDPLPACTGASGPACKSTLPQCPATSAKVTSQGGTPRNPDVRDIVVDPTNSNNVIAATDCGLFRSQDRGYTWAPVASSVYDVYAHLILHAPTHTLFASYDVTFAKNNGLFGAQESDWDAIGTVRKSSDWGTTWTPVGGANPIELLGNGDFESGTGNSLPAGWSMWGGPGTVSRDCSSGVTPYGQCAVRIDVSGVGFEVGLKKTVSVVAGTVYTDSARVRVDGPDAPVDGIFPARSVIQFFDASHIQIGGNYYPYFATRTDSTYFRYEGTLKAPAGAVTADVIYDVDLYGPSSMSPGTKVYIDDARFEKLERLPRVNGAYVKQNGVPGTERPVGWGSYTPIAVDPTDANTLYAMNDNATFVGDSNGLIGVWKSTDGGQTWHQTMSANSVFDPKSPDTSKYGGFVLAIGSGAAGRNTLYAGGGFQLWKTSNGGTQWNAVSYSADPNNPPSPGHPGYYSARGDLNNVWATFLVTDPNQPQRIYYGDADNALQVSRNGGATWTMIGAPIDNPSYPLDPSRDWNAATVTASAPYGIASDSATSMILDPSDSNHILVGANIAPGFFGPSSTLGGTVQATYNAASDLWSWSPLGTQSCLVQGGTVRLMRERTSGTLLSAVLGRGLARMTVGGDWVSLGSTCDPITFPTSSTWTSPPGASAPSGWWINRLAQSPNSSRVFAAFGEPGLAPLNTTRNGVWMTDNLGNTWTKISFGSSFEMEPVVDVVPLDDQTVLAATYGGYDYNVVGHGGIYRGVQSGSSWSWTKVLGQHGVSSIARSPFSPNLFYALSVQLGGLPLADSNPGIYRSTDAGVNWTGPLPRNGLGSYVWSQLDFSRTDPRKLYSSTLGSGVYAGTLPCDNNGTCTASDEFQGVCGDCSKMYFELWAVTGSAPTLPGVGTVDPRDILVYDPVNGSYSRFFQGSAAGIPSGAQIDAFGKMANGDLLFSFKAAVTLSGTAFTPCDIVKFHPTTPGNYTSGTYSYFLRGSNIGLTNTSAENVDGLYLDTGGDLYFSTDGNGSVTGLNFNASDIVKFHPTTPGNYTSGTSTIYFHGDAAGITPDVEDINSIFISSNSSGQPQIFVSTGADPTVPVNPPTPTPTLSAKRIDVLRFTATALNPNPVGTWMVFRSGQAIGLNTNWQVRGVWFEAP